MKFDFDREIKSLVKLGLIRIVQETRDLPREEQVAVLTKKGEDFLKELN